MNINIRTNEIFKTKYDKLCKACGKNQTSMLIDTMSKIISFCHMADDESLDDDIRQLSKEVLFLLNINYKEFIRLEKEG